MRIPLSWLKEYVDIDITVDELLKRLTSVGHMQDKPPEKVGDDMVLDLEVRQNRPDCLSILGVAREVAAVTGKKIQVRSPKSEVRNKLTGGGLTIDNAEPKLCRRFRACRIRLRTMDEGQRTPTWLKDRLSAYGIKTISPIVDITNYVMVEYGEPMHAFDADTVTNGNIIIRTAKKGEKLTILGGRELSLTQDDLVIADESKILSFSGLIGGEGSGVSEHTKEIILEAATYNHAVIRRSSLRHSVRTEASTRHEKFLHPHLAEVALDRAVQLVLDICGGEIVAYADSYPDPEKDLEVTLPLSEIARLGGISVTLEQARLYLTSLGFLLLSTDDSRLTTRVPYWRTDIECEADLVEEIVRLYGYENITPSLPPNPPPKDISSVWFSKEEKVRDVLVQIGFDEQITEPLTTNQSAVGSQQSAGKQIVLQNALNADKNALRVSLRSGLMHALTHARKIEEKEIKVFEIGKVYSHQESMTQPYIEKRVLGAVLYIPSSDITEVYRIAKGVAEYVVNNILNAESTAQSLTLEVADDHTVFFEIYLEELVSNTNKDAKGKLLSSIPKIQTFDVSVVLGSDIKLDELIKQVKSEIPEITSMTLGEKPRKMKENEYSVLLRCTLIDSSKQKESLQSALHSILTQRYNGIIR